MIFWGLISILESIFCVVEGRGIFFWFSLMFFIELVGEGLSFRSVVKKEFMNLPYSSLIGVEGKVFYSTQYEIGNKVQRLDNTKKKCKQTDNTLAIQGRVYDTSFVQTFNGETKLSCEN